MADNTVINPGASGDTIATDDISGVKHQRVKLSVGADGAASDAVPVVAALDSTGTGIQAVGIVAQFDDVSTASVTENQFAAPRISSRRALLVEGVASGTVIPVSDGGGSITVDNSGTFVTQENGAALTALQLIDDVVVTDDAAFTPGTTKVLMVGATLNDTTPDVVNEGDGGAVRMTADRAIHSSIRDAAGNNRGVNVTAANQMEVSVTAALPTGSAAIGKLAANSGVDIGDVDVTSISAGTNLVGDVGIQPRTTNGLDTFMASGSDGSSILVATAQAAKASAGKVYGYYAYNPETAVSFVHFYNTASGSVTVGTTNPLFSLPIPPGAAANLMSEIGITFGTAITVAATTTAGGNTAPTTGVSLVVWYK